MDTSTLLATLLALPLTSPVTHTTPDGVVHVYVPPMLSAWERDFCLDVLGQVTLGRSLSDAQQDLVMTLGRKYLGDRCHVSS